MVVRLEGKEKKNKTRQDTTRSKLDRSMDDLLAQGLVSCLDCIDSVVSIIRGSADLASARQDLLSTIGLNSEQAEAVLAMPLRRLVAIEAHKLRAESEELEKEIEELEKVRSRAKSSLLIDRSTDRPPHYLRSLPPQILASDSVVKDILKTEARECQDMFGVKRRTAIIPSRPGSLDWDPPTKRAGEAQRAVAGVPCYSSICYR